MDELFNDYGCDVSKFTDINMLKLFTKRLDKIFSNKDTTKFLSCKDDASVFVVVTNKYVVKLYNSKKYLELVNIYDRLLKKSYDFANIEKIYYYYAVFDGLIVHDTYLKIFPELPPINSNIYGTANELLIPIFSFEMGEIKTRIKWDKGTVYKLFNDVSSGLIELHKNNIIHGDTTPDNVGLRIDNNFVNFVIYDFGDSYIMDNKLNKNELMKGDVNRFLNSVLITYSYFFKDYINNIKKLKRDINTGNYTINKFKNSIKF